MVVGCGSDDRRTDLAPSTTVEPASEAATAPPTIGLPSTTTSTSPAPHSTTTATTTVAAAYAFPVEPQARATYARTHHDYPAADIFAPCGSRVVAPTSGTLTELRRVDAWTAGHDTGATRGGLSFTLLGGDGVRYYGSHLRTVSAAVDVGDHVAPGAPIGTVGDTGNAEGTGCHLHFGLSPPCPRREWRVRRGTIHPQPYLDSWRVGRSDNPAHAIARWAADNPRACEEAASLPDAGAA